MTTKAFRLADAERTTIVNALTVAARQYERDAEQALEMALHAMTIREPAEALAAQLRQHAADARQLRDKITFLWEHVQF
jgi:rubrerythrin